MAMKKIRNNLALAFLTGSVLALSACGKKEETPAPKVERMAMTNNLLRVAGTAERDMKQERSEFVKKAQKDIDELDAKIMELKQKAESATGKAKRKMEYEIGKLQPLRKAAVEKLDELKVSTGEAWRNLKAGVESAIDRLRQAVMSARKRSGSA